MGRTEQPRVTVVGPQMAPPVELQRWIRQTRSRPYEYKPRAAGLHAFASIRRKVPIELPLLLFPQGAVGGLLPSLLALEDELAPRESLFPSAEDRQFVERLCDSLFAPAVKTFYFNLLPVRSVLAARATAGTPAMDRLIVRLAYPLWAAVMRRGLKLGEFDPTEAAAEIDRVFGWIESDLGSKPFLRGEEPGTGDLVFAVLASPVILPPHHPAPLPSLEELPEPFRTQLQGWRARPAGALALRIYERRGAAEDYGKVPRDRATLLQRLATPRLVRAVARIAARAAPPVIRAGKQAFVSSWEHVQEVLLRDSEFLIGPVNRERIEGVMGPFVLGMDNGARLQSQRQALYAALRAVDHEAAVRLVEDESQRIAAASADRFGRIDVVNGYARPIAARAAALMFGMTAPHETDLMRAARAVFHETFLNLGGEAEVQAAGRSAGAEIASWIEEEVARRGGKPGREGDLLNGLLAQVHAGALAPEEVSWIAAGLLVGAIDTTATSVANIVSEVVIDAALGAAMRRDAEDDRLLLGWCWEALRRRPHNPLLLRQAASDLRLAGRPIAGGTRVWALTLAAMQDKRIFPEPHRLDPERPLDLYMHFGVGLHRCSGRLSNDRHIPLLVRALLRRGVSGPHDLRFRGPFPDRLVVRLERGQ